MDKTVTHEDLMTMLEKIELLINLLYAQKKDPRLTFSREQLMEHVVNTPCPNEIDDIDPYQFGFIKRCRQMESLDPVDDESEDVEGLQNVLDGIRQWKAGRGK